METLKTTLRDVLTRHEREALLIRNELNKCTGDFITYSANTDISGEWVQYKTCSDEREAYRGMLDHCSSRLTYMGTSPGCKEIFDTCNGSECIDNMATCFKIAGVAVPYTETQTDDIFTYNEVLESSTEDWIQLITNLPQNKWSIDTIVRQNKTINRLTKELEEAKSSTQNTSIVEIMASAAISFISITFQDVEWYYKLLAFISVGVVYFMVKKCQK